MALLINDFPAGITLQACCNVPIKDSSSHLVQAFLASHCASVVINLLTNL